MIQWKNIVIWSESMKTNHRRNFVDTYHDYSAGPMRIRNPAVRCEISGVAVQPKHIGFDFSNGHRGKPNQNVV